MTTYIVKTILCSAILILIYYLVLEREKIYRFNRFYLLFSILFAFIVPLITIRIRSAVILIPETVYLPVSNAQTSVSQQTLSPVNESLPLGKFVLLAYMAVTLFLFCRFIINIIILLSKIKNNISVPYYDAKLVLIMANQVPHSFLKYIFINKDDFDKGNIEKEILSHELAHIKQRHSIDILFIELMTIFAWINPILYLYRKAIQLNHEFLADEVVINTFTSPLDYQLLLIDKARQPSVLVLSSSFNYLQTKKRIIMMTKKTSFRIAILKQIALIPVLVATGFLFSTKAIAQDIKKPSQQQASTTQHQQKGSIEDLPSFNHDKYTFSMGFASWVASQIQYPPTAMKEKIQGWVHVVYTVEPDGTISNVNINSAPDPLLGEAVAKAVKSSPKWMASMNKENAASFKSAVNIKFEIPERVLSSQDIPVYAVDKVPITEDLPLFLEADKMPQLAVTKNATLKENDAALGEWIAQHLKYPDKALKEKIEGNVEVRFIVTKSGRLEDFTVIKSIHPLLDSEALRVLSLLPKWNPATSGGEPKDVYYYTMVEFKLPK